MCINVSIYAYVKYKFHQVPLNEELIPTISRNVTPERLHVILYINNSATNSSNSLNDADKPPRYDEVPIAEVSGEPT